MSDDQRRDPASERLRRAQRFGPISDACKYAGIGRSSMYEAVAERPDLFKKWGGRTLVDFDVLDEILDRLSTMSVESSVRAKELAARSVAARKTRKQTEGFAQRATEHRKAKAGAEAP